MKLVLRLAGLGCLALIVLLSLLPAQDMWRTGAPKAVEHFAAYYIGSLILALGIGRNAKFRLTLGLVALAALMEILQSFSPGRTPHMSDFLASASGAVSAILIATALQAWAGHHRSIS